MTKHSFIKSHDFKNKRGTRFIRRGLGEVGDFAMFSGPVAFWIGWHGDHWSTAIAVKRHDGDTDVHQMCFKGGAISAVKAYRMTMAWVEKYLMGQNNLNSPWVIRAVSEDDVPASTVH